MAAIEFAIVLPVLLLILFAIIDMGRYLQQYIQLTEAAREGARLGALNGSVTEVKAKVQGIVGPGVTLSYPSGPAVCGTGTAIDSSVTVTRPFDPATPLFKLLVLFGDTGQSATRTIKAIGVMSCLG